MKVLFLLFACVYSLEAGKGEPKDCPIDGFSLSVVIACLRSMIEKNDDFEALKGRLALRESEGKVALGYRGKMGSLWIRKGKPGKESKGAEGREGWEVPPRLVYVLRGAGGLRRVDSITRIALDRGGPAMAVRLILESLLNGGEEPLLEETSIDEERGEASDNSNRPDQALYEGGEIQPLLAGPDTGEVTLDPFSGEADEEEDDNSKDEDEQWNTLSEQEASEASALGKEDFFEAGYHALEEKLFGRKCRASRQAFWGPGRLFSLTSRPKQSCPFNDSRVFFGKVKIGRFEFLHLKLRRPDGRGAEIFLPNRSDLGRGLATTVAKFAKMHPGANQKI